MSDDLTSAKLRSAYRAHYPIKLTRLNQIIFSVEILSFKLKEKINDKKVTRRFDDSMSSLSNAKKISMNWWYIYKKRKCQEYVKFRACLQGGGGPRMGEVTFGGSPHLSCKRDQIKMRDYMDRRVTPPKRVTPPTWGPPPPCKQAVNWGVKMEQNFKQLNKKFRPDGIRLSV